MQEWVLVCASGSPSLLFFCWRCKDRPPPGKCPYTSMKAPPHSLAPFLLFSSDERRKWNSLITNPSLWTKKNMHYSRSHWIIASNTWPHHPANQHPHPQHPQFNFEVKSSSLSLFILSLPLSLFVSQNALQNCLTWYFLPHLVFTSLFPLGWCWECILMVVVSVINEKMDNLTTGRSFM